MQCSKCGDDKPVTVEFFHRCSKARNGFSSQCKLCRRAWFVAHPDYHTIRYRQNPAAGKANTAAYRARQKALGNKPELRTAYAAAWRGRNRERLRAYYENYRAVNKGDVRAHSLNYTARKKEASGKHTGEDIQRQFDAQNGKCHWCAKPLVKYHADHRIPLSRGGSNGPENIVIACPHCNISKGAKLPEEWAGAICPPA